MTNEPKMAPSAPVNDVADQPVKAAPDAKPADTVAPAPTTPPSEPKKI